MKKSLIKPNKQLDIPKPMHEYGYTSHQLENFMSQDETRKFSKWIRGQTCLWDDDLGCVYYTHDVERFLRLVRHNTPTYWD